MSNKTQLQANNNELDALIARVNAAKNTVASLPEAGGGEDVTAETNEYTTLNAELEEVINSLPEAGDGGGAMKMKVCNITMSGIYFADSQVTYTKVNDDNSLTTHTEVFTPETFTIYTANLVNVLCDSIIVVNNDCSSAGNGGITGTAELIQASENFSIFKAPSVEGEECSILIGGN